MGPPGSARAGEGRPRRLCCLYQPNGVHPSGWDIASPGGLLHADFLPEVLQPLAHHVADCSIVAGLDNRGSGHVQLASAFLSGVPVSGGRAGVSLDQLAARHLGQATSLPSLVLGTEPPRQGNTAGEPISLSNTVSWTGPDSRIQPEVDPQAAFNRLFRDPRDPAFARRARLRQSVVDLVGEDARALRRRASGPDAEKLDQYLTAVREVEQRLERLAGAPATGAPPVEPAFSLTKEGREAHLRSILEIAALALWTDSTRVVTVMTAHGFSRLDYGFLEGVRGDHHGLSHHKNQPEMIAQYNRVCRWFVEQFAWFLARLASLRDGEHTLLENCAVLYGSGMKDGNGHVPRDLPLIVAGGAGGSLKQGQHLRAAPGTPHANLLITLARALGLELPDLNGASTGLVPELLA